MAAETRISHGAWSVIGVAHLDLEEEGGMGAVRVAGAMGVEGEGEVTQGATEAVVEGIALAAGATEAGDNTVGRDIGSMGQGNVVSCWSKQAERICLHINEEKFAPQET